MEVDDTINDLITQFADDGIFSKFQVQFLSWILYDERKFIIHCSHSVLIDLELMWSKNYLKFFENILLLIVVWKQSSVVMTIFLNGHM